MRIDALEVWHVAMPLVSPWRTSYGEEATIESILVQLHSDGQSAWGEVTPGAQPRYSPEWAGGVFACLQYQLGPAILGEWISSGTDLQEKLAGFRGNYFAKAALDVSWWVLKAVQQGKPLYQLLGGQPGPIAVGADFGVAESPQVLLKQIGEAVTAGFARVKLKFRPGWDVAMLRAVRSEHPELTLHIDCNGAYRLQEHLEMFCRLDDFHLSMIEQPLAYDDLWDHARLQETIQTPICLDESITSPDKAEQAALMGACRWINIKPGRVGGLTPALQILDVCRQEGLQCWIGGMLESAVGANIALALASHPHCSYPPDIFPSSRFYSPDLSEPALELIQTSAGAPAAQPKEVPGIGVAPNPELLERYTKQHFTLRAE